MNVPNVQAAIKARLDTISGLRTFSYVPDTVDPPTAVAGPPSIMERIDFGGGVRAEFPVWIVVSRADDRTGQAALWAYLSEEGAQSIVAAVEGGTGNLGGTVNDVRWLNTGEVHGNYDIGGQSYFGAQINFEVLAE